MRTAKPVVSPASLHRTAKPSVALVVPHHGLRRALRDVLTHHSLTVPWEAAGTAEALTQLARHRSSHYCLVYTDMPFVSVERFIAALRHAQPGMRVIALTSDYSPQNIQQLKAAGAVQVVDNNGEVEWVEKL